MLYKDTVGDLMKYTLRSAMESGFTNNLYFSPNILKRHFVRSNFQKVISATVRYSTNKETCLDFGPGFGILLPALSKIFDRTVGLDIDKNQLIPAAKIMKDHSISNVDLVCRPPEIEFDDFISESFDCIVADNVLEHISDHYQIIRNFYRILKMGGILIISLPTENIIYRLFESEGDGHVLQTKKQINSLLEKIGSSFTEIGRLNTPPFFLLRIFQKSVMV